MPVLTEYAPGAPCWYELIATDRDAANAFYSDIFGWTVENVSAAPGQNYTMFQLGGLTVAASTDLHHPGTSAHWLTYFHVPEIDAAAARVTQLGGSVLMAPFDVAAHGRMAVLRDPEGATFALWKAGTHIGAERYGENNSVGWSELVTRDNEKAAKFYADLLGVTIASHTAPAHYIEFSTESHRAGGLLQMEPSWGEIPPHWGFYVQVADCDRVVDRVKELGGKVRHGPFDAPGVGRIAMLMDAQGASFNVITLEAAA